MIEAFRQVHWFHGTLYHAMRRKQLLLLSDNLHYRIFKHLKNSISAYSSFHFCSADIRISAKGQNSSWSLQDKNRLINELRSSISLRPKHSFFLHQVRKFRCSIDHCDRKRNTKSTDPVKNEESQSSIQNQKQEDRGQAENIFTIPNAITTFRIAATPYLGYLVLHEQFSWAAGLFIVAGVTDFIDGYIARNFKNQMSVLGSALDPLADKLLISVLTITLTMANLIPVPLTCVIVGRDVFLILASCFYRYKSIESPVTVAKYFDAKSATIKFFPSTISKLNTAAQMSLVTFTLAAPVFGFINHPFLQVLWYLTAATTVSSGVGYMINRDKHIKLQ